MSNNFGVPEIVDGVLREGQIAVLCGYYGTGKSPLVSNLAFCIRNGLEWLGRRVSARDVVLLDFETPRPTYDATTEALKGRYNAGAACGVCAPHGCRSCSELGADLTP